MDALKVQKEIAKEVLEVLEVIDPTCILAGGAPRDWFWGRVASDLDFYVHDARKLSQGDWERRLNKTLLDVRPLGQLRPESADEEYGSLSGLKHVFEGEYMGQTVQVMVMSTPTFSSVVDHFCMDNSKIWWKGGRVQPTFEFLLANATRTLKVCSDYAPKQRYIDKMVKKFPEFKLETCDKCYAERKDKFVEVAQVKNEDRLVEKWLEINKTYDRANVSVPFWLGW